MPKAHDRSDPREATVVFLVGAVQFINILDFMMVSPLGPFMSEALAFPQSNAGWITGSYTAAAAVSGLAGAFFLDRFERKRALSVALVGLAAGTLAGAFATDLSSLLAARILAGLFGGPATSIAMSIIADVVPAERRGQAMGKVMGAFAAASVLGVPFGLELTLRISWRAPFVFTAALGVAVAALALARLPALRAHLTAPRGRTIWGELRRLARPEVLLSYAMTWVAMGASFVLIPNIAAYTLLNLGFPASRLGLLYMAGGAVSFATMRAAGPLVDRFGSAPVGALGTLLLTIVILLGFAVEPPVIPVVAIFMGFMFAMSLRNLSYNTLTTKVPEPAERAAFMSVQSAVQHLASATGAIVSAALLAERADKSLAGMNRVAALSVGLGLVLPPMLFVVEGRVRRRPTQGT